jgi:polyketide biosynthesis enoyl-CoA hydratase PksI
MSSDEFASLTINAEGIAVLRMCDEKSGNALSEGMVHRLESLFTDIASHDAIKVVILAGLPEYFCSGASRDVLLKLAENQIEPHELTLPRHLLRISVPTIAAMEGHAIGGGLALGICCDIVLVARESSYSCPFMNYGFTPGMGTTRLLEHVVSPAIAHEMLFTGRPFKGSQFEHRSGFNHVVPRSDLWSRTMDISERIAEKPRAALVLLKKNLIAGRRKVYEGAFQAETEMHQKTFYEPSVIARILEE